TATDAGIDRGWRTDRACCSLGSRHPDREESVRVAASATMRVATTTDSTGTCLFPPPAKNAVTRRSVTGKGMPADPGDGWGCFVSVSVKPDANERNHDERQFFVSSLSALSGLPDRVADRGDFWLAATCTLRRAPGCGWEATASKARLVSIRSRGGEVDR